jgi:predicted MFS family arabinose efflux permease
MDRAAITALRRSHGYPQFLAAATVARVADEMFAIGVVLLILDRTGSPTLAGLTVAAVTFPAILSGPVIGAWLDRTGRRSLIYKIDRLLLTAVLLAILAVAGRAPDFLLPLLALVTGLTLPVTFSGFTSMIPLMVAEEMLPSANAVEAASQNLALIVGPGLAGLLAAVAGPPAALVGEAALTLVALALILRIPDLNRGASERPEPLREMIARGLRHVVHEPVLRIVSVAGVFNNIGWGVLMIVFPLWAAGDLGSTSSASGALWAAFASGSLIGALGLARFYAAYPPERVAFAAMFASGVGMLTWLLAGSLLVALTLVVLTAVLEGPVMASVFSVRQQRTPGDLQAQVMGTLGSVQIAAFSIGTAIGGPVVVALGPRASILAAACTILSAGAIGAAVRAAIRHPAAR